MLAAAYLADAVAVVVFAVAVVAYLNLICVSAGFYKFVVSISRLNVCCGTPLRETDRQTGREGAHPKIWKKICKSPKSLRVWSKSIGLC